jgi:hypothetical protein
MTMTTVKMSPAISLPAPHDMSVGPNVANAGDATRILGSVAPCRVYSRALSLARVTPGDRAHHLRPEQCQDEVAFRSADRAPDCLGDVPSALPACVRYGNHERAEPGDPATWDAAAHSAAKLAFENALAPARGSRPGSGNRLGHD